ncbi:hypothetical protein DICVIV_05399 [Dictyocaulus viviparus]|uniref:Ubiquitin carboxyl-terminal hydrolase n=1 Tax=Dictyocaulus viviparus TaxID=29172 RepID=A0A0D8XV43_DICVI|nr:hypothetical protein DICVIV_05399 [Dictyocaulus viviparus]
MSNSTIPCDREKANELVEVAEVLNYVLDKVELAFSCEESSLQEGYDNMASSSGAFSRLYPKDDNVFEVKQNHEINSAKHPSQDSRDIFKLRTIQYNSIEYSIVTQNLNGPCPLISVINVLVLKGVVKLPRSGHVTREALTHLVADALLQLRPENMSTHTEINYDKNLDDVINLLPDLGRGLDVNISYHSRFRKVTDFEFTPALSLFDLLHVNLYHGWLPDPQFVEISNAIGDLTYNQLVEQICDDENINRLLLQEFLNDNVSQLTYHGLVSLMQTMHDGELAVLFRNNHFHPIHKWMDLLYLLVSDSGYANEPSIVWESFNNVDGNSVFFTGDFTFSYPVNEHKQHAECSTDADFLLAQEIQKYEDKLAMQESQKDNRESPPQNNSCSSSFNDNMTTFERLPYNARTAVNNWGQKDKKPLSAEIMSTSCAAISQFLYDILGRLLEAIGFGRAVSLTRPAMSGYIANRNRTACRYFISGCCSQGDRCAYSHDRNSPVDLVCRYYLKGTCAYGTACRYDHTRPKANNSDSSCKEHTTEKPSSLPKQENHFKPGLNVSAEEFMPAWKRKTVGTSYAVAAGSSASEKYLPLCPYFEMGECKNQKCQFVHGLVCDMCSRACIHPYDEKQQKQHFAECLKAHEIAMEHAIAAAKGAGKCCGICMENIIEKNLRFGILEGCRHCFCLGCIREWRRNQSFETDVVRSCPECRKHSNFVMPSTLWVEEDDEKRILCEVYRSNMAQKQCRYYKEGVSAEGCPFGNKCFYKHQLPDGSIDPGEPPHSRKRPDLADFIFNRFTSNSDEDTL